MVGGREMRDLEVRAPESSDARGYPRDLLADDRAGRVQGLRKQSYGLGRAPVFVGDVTANVLAPARGASRACASSRTGWAEPPYSLVM